MRGKILLKLVVVWLRKEDSILNTASNKLLESKQSCQDSRKHSSLDKSSLKEEMSAAEAAPGVQQPHT